jgi:hypothetical protein
MLKLLNLRFFADRHAQAKLSAISLTEAGWCSPSRRSSFGGRPRPLNLQNE